MKKYKIDKNIPPTNARENGKYDFPFKDMEVGDSFIVTEDGYECITPYPNKVSEVII